MARVSIVPTAGIARFLGKSPLDSHPPPRQNAFVSHGGASAPLLA
jgi:hypothetical protein